ncbi:hypothetical protein QB910_000123 [Dabrowskivirus KKP3916]|uniref:Uncharacterized protein n=1 Tax=Alicyclobacillus phage KKP_3916 TaxID=3040651 RepID=A0AAT9V828_9CAUD|nr:hypothetical protein QB910_000123 [Alicyclobacillus phage KKP 3916]
MVTIIVPKTVSFSECYEPTLYEKLKRRREGIKQIVKYLIERKSSHGDVSFTQTKEELKVSIYHNETCEQAKEIRSNILRLKFKYWQ